MTEMWSYDKDKRIGKNGMRWHFVKHYIFVAGSDDEPYELYFRNDERTEFGLLRFERRRDNPYRDYPTILAKIMNSAEFRATLLKPETADVWNKNWK